MLGVPARLGASMPLMIGFVVMLFALALPAAEESVPSLAAALQTIEGDLAADRQAMDADEKQIEQERAAALARLSALRREIAALEAELASIHQQDAARQEADVAAKGRLATAVATQDYLNQTATEYCRAFAARLAIGEAQLYAAPLNAIDAARPAMTALPTLLELSGRQAAAAVGGDRFAGQAVDAAGNLRQGQFAQLGPLLYFADDGELAGMAQAQADSALPVIVATPGGAASVRDLLSSGQATLAVDVSGGAALRLADSRDSLVEHLRKGGVVMVPLLLLAAICLVLGCYKLATLGLLRTGGAEGRIAAILLALKRGDLNVAYVEARQLHRPLGPVICEGIEHRDASKEHIEEIMYERLMAQVPSLEKLLSPLAVCASVAPLLGLLGTVTGMIHTFRLITVFGTGDARVLSGGISEALITTEVGLAIAIPALLLHAYLSRRVRKAIAASQQSAIMFVNGLKLRLEPEARLADADD